VAGAQPVYGETAWTESVLYSFSGGADGFCLIEPLTAGGPGVLFDTTEFGVSAPSQYGNGVVVKRLNEPVAPRPGKGKLDEMALRIETAFGVKMGLCVRSSSSIQEAAITLWRSLHEELDACFSTVCRACS
jgi:hypothetical protein